MRNRILRTLATLLSLSLTLASCQNDEEGQAELLPEGNELQVMAVFAPGQLGDYGFADNVLNGLIQLKQGNEAITDATVDADFISRYDFPSTRRAVEEWLGNPVNPVNSKTYTRRLLVLTEPFMAGWLMTCKDLLRQTDEVLVLKVIQEDIDAANDTLKLGDRLHAVNISMSEPIRRFCKTVQWYVENQNEDDSVRINTELFPTYRLYSEELKPSRDSIYETMKEEMEDVGFLKMFFFAKDSEGYPMPIYGSNTLEQRLSFLLQSFIEIYRYGMIFPICDFGISNSAIDFYMMNHTDVLFQPLLLDAGPSKVDRLYILRPFDRVLSDWVWRWTQTETGAMPVTEVHGDWDGFPCETNLDPFDDKEYWEDEEDEDY